MYSWTQKYVGIPFKSGGRDSNGCDCYGLVRMILQNEYHIQLPSLSEYTDALNSSELQPLFTKNIPLLCAEKITYPEETAVALIRTHGGMFTHVGLFAGDDYIIHVRCKTGCVLEKIGSPVLRNRIEGWYRVNKTYYSKESVLK